MKRRINAMLAAGITGTLIFVSIFAANYGEILFGSKDIWWTPMPLALPLNDTRQEFELYIKGDLLQKHLERGTIAFAAKEGQSLPLTINDVKVRLNNWHKIKSSGLTGMAVVSFFLGISFTLLIMGIIQFFKREKTG